MKSPVEKIAVIGLGYVGSPLAALLAEHFDVLGFDTSAQRVADLQQQIDATDELPESGLKLLAEHAKLTHAQSDLADRSVFIVTVPTPIDTNKAPDFRPLIAASKAIAKHLRPGNLVIYESTVFPGATEEICVPVLEADSGLKFGVDFEVGYSPERVNPGDKSRKLEQINKIISASSTRALARVRSIYAPIIKADLYEAPSIRVAEAAKVIENTQRDVNIALANEFALIFARLGIDSKDVFDAAASKWNFLPFKPGLVGGHCISVDPYYLIQKAQSVGYEPHIISTSRRVNDAVSAHVAACVVAGVRSKAGFTERARVLILGLAFKENCPDIRNSRVPDLKRALEEAGMIVEIYDPCVQPEHARAQYGINLLEKLTDSDRFDGVVLAVAHHELIALMPDGLAAVRKADCFVYDVKAVWPRHLIDARL